IHIAQPLSFNKEPENLSVIECKLYEANKQDFEWYRSYFADLPDYLTKYFVNRYLAIFKKEGNREANTFLREKMEPARSRVRLVLAQYGQLPTTHKITLLSEENDLEQS
ncbi:replication endonuclease, partial [Vibrio anguillarum]|nr:replication endonuclease [Vibrio anguillarum]